MKRQPKSIEYAPVSPDRARRTADIIAKAEEDSALAKVAEQLMTAPINCPRARSLVLGLDPALGNGRTTGTGWCLWYVDDPNPTGYLASGMIAAPRDTTLQPLAELECRARIICEGLNEATGQYQSLPSLTIVEVDLVRPLRATAISRLAFLCGWLANEFSPSMLIGPQQWKGTKSKADTQTEMGYLLGRDFPCDDEADAVGIAHWGVSNARLQAHIQEA